jgi:hypothetical protein
MHFSFVIASLLSLACVVNAVNFTVTVGFNSTLTYNPPYVTGVMDNDNIVFVFNPKNHTVTQSTFADPCTRMTGGFASGFKPFNGTGDQPVFVHTVANASAPTWVYCGQTGHCEQGMVFAINPPTTGNTFEAFQTKAKSVVVSSSAAPSGTATTPVYGSATGTATGTASGTATGTASAASGTASTTSAGMKVGGSAASALAMALLVGLAL